MPIHTFPLLLALASGTTAPTELAVFVFENGLPLGGAEVRAGNETLGQTAVTGDLFVTTDAAFSEMAVVVAGRELTRFSLQPEAGEVIRVVINLDPGQAPDVQVQRSGGRGGAVAPSASDTTLAPGTLEGLVNNADDDEPLPGARVFISGQGAPVRTDAQGRFRMVLKPGTYAVSVLMSGFNTTTREGMVIQSNQVTPLTLDLTPVGLELPEYKVTAPHVQGSLASVFDTRRESSEVMEVLGAEQMTRAGASDAADALKRVTGLTVVDGKYVFVRGLGDRYSTTLLNGTALPSPDPTRRVVPLDLFPTTMLGSVVVQKTYSPQMPGDFSGGAVILRTKGVPEEDFFRVQFSLGADTQGAFQDGLTYNGGGTDFLGLDDGTRALPQSFLDATNDGTVRFSDVDDAERERIGEMLPRQFNTQSRTLPPDAGLNLSGGLRWGDDVDNLGLRVTGLYNDRHGLQDEERARFNTSDEVIDASELSRTQRLIDLGGMVSLLGNLSDQHQFEALGLASRKSRDEVRVNTTNGQERITETTDLQWIEEEVLSAQMRGEHTFDLGPELSFDWNITYTEANRDEPDRRTIQYAKLFPEDPFQLAAFGGLGTNPLLRSYQTQKDTLQNALANLTLLFEDVGPLSIAVKGGFNRVAGDRDQQFRLFLYQVPSNPPNSVRNVLEKDPESIITAESISPGAWEISNGSLDSDSYTANQNVLAGYAMAEIDWGDHVSLSVGARYESSRLEVNTQTSEGPLDVLLEDDDLLPAASATWKTPLDGLQLRLGVSRTVNRPQFRELTPIQVLNVENLNVERGNPDLITANITNYDGRLEYYWSSTEGVSAAVFYKSFENPIERTFVGGGTDGNGVRTFGNVQNATIAGVEIEGRIGLGNFTSLFERFTLATNVAVIQSEVSLSPEQSPLYTNRERPLQGQSPWVLNAQLEYSNADWGLDATVLFNMSGPRIAEVGILGLQDTLEQSVPLLDAVVSYQITERARFGLRLRNLLDPEYQETLGANGPVNRRYRRGTAGSLSFAYTLPW